jgi:outer membrane protein OmpA-like peptidoglycan-associated protein
MVVFEQGIDNICNEIHLGTADIKRLIPSSKTSSVGLNNNPSGDQLYSLELREGQKICILFNTDDKSKEKLKLEFNFDVLNAKSTNGETKVVDLRDDEFSPAFHIVVRDASNGQPVVANLTVLGLKNLSALYMGSDFFFTIEKNGKITIKCDAKGYFFADRVENVVANVESEFTIWLEPLKQGKSLQIEEIEFHPGSSDFMPTSEGKLRRLKDFMALNSEVKIEIQGHVFSTDGNSFAGQKLSEARAKRVYNYLVDNGINKDRMTTVGFGSTKPIFAKPKLAYEEQMNRRVEIKVL